MSLAHHEEQPIDPEQPVAMVIEGRRRDLGDNVSVRRVLPSPHRHMVGPFIFVDHMGPIHMTPGMGMDVRPHPHINLATVTYLFSGEILHRDSLGSEQIIRPGEINWMHAGSGIVHSERSPSSARAAGAQMHGMQLWVALPTAHEETPPVFYHHAANSLPEVDQKGVRFRVLVGDAYGAKSPVKTLSQTLYVDAQLDQGATLQLPQGYEERCVYIAQGRVGCDGVEYAEGMMLVVGANREPPIHALSQSRLMVMGGEPLGERHIFWNFVSSSAERIEKAKADWRERRFPVVPGDESEFIPLP